jgi:hypothetical protein
MTEHDDLDDQIGVLGPLQPEDLDGPDEGEIDEREGHEPFSPSDPYRGKPQIKGPDEILGTHRQKRSSPSDPLPRRAG